jgi:hypothetical protein
LKTLKKQLSPPKRQTRREFLELQRLMAGAVMRPLAAGGGMQPKWRDGRSMGKVAGQFIKPNDRLTSFERLEIYNRQYWFRIKDCFYEDYPGLRAILGERRFERLACAYLTRHPSHSFTLRNLGRSLVEFLEAEPRWTGPLKHPALDMARLEWAHVEAFDNEARPPLEMDSLLGVDPAQICLRLQPHLTLLQLRYELDEFLIEVKKGEGLRNEASNAMEQHRARKKTSSNSSCGPRPSSWRCIATITRFFTSDLNPASFASCPPFSQKRQWPRPANRSRHRTMRIWIKSNHGLNPGPPWAGSANWNNIYGHSR